MTVRVYKPYGQHRQNGLNGQADAIFSIPVKADTIEYLTPIAAQRGDNDITETVQAVFRLGVEFLKIYKVSPRSPQGDGMNDQNVPGSQT
jgi:hypothetical protein